MINARIAQQRESAGQIIQRSQAQSLLHAPIHKRDIDPGQDAAMTESVKIGNNTETLGDLRRWLDESGLPDETMISIVGYSKSPIGDKLDFDKSFFDIKHEYDYVEIDIGQV